MEEIDENEENALMTKKVKKKRMKKSKSDIPNPMILFNNSDSLKHKVWHKKLRKFRTTSWVVRVCTDFAIPYP